LFFVGEAAAGTANEGLADEPVARASLRHEQKRLARA
jgi:hypothetical protein